MTPEHSSVSVNLQDIRLMLQASFHSGVTRPLKYRIELLDRIERLILENQERICEAIEEDLGRPREDTIVVELSVVIEEIHAARRQLPKWIQPSRPTLPLVLFPSRGYITSVPYGVALIISPWNYPVQLLLAPLVSALAAGNCALLKPSELTPASSQLLAELLPQYLPNNIVHIVTGGVEISTELLKFQWDVVFFTGSTAVGRIVARATAEHLTPTILELGGKSPCIVDKGIPLEIAARRILWGKTMNAGQTCVAPDYILVHSSQASELLSSLESTLTQFFPQGYVRKKSFCGIVNKLHFDRLSSLIHEHSDCLRLGGRIDVAAQLIEPTVFVMSLEQARSAKIMGEEIFGPLLPIITFDNPNDAVTFIKSKDHPLTLYVFSNDREFCKTLEQETQSGSLVINDTVIQLATSKLPFGGVGASGNGSYHGKAGFNAFSHKRALLKRPFALDLPIRYRPFARWKLWLLRKLMKFPKVTQSGLPRA